MRYLSAIAFAAMSLATTAPAFAQDAMMKDGMAPGSMMKMSAAETRKMNACNAMSHDKMMKNAGCRAMMKAHPDMMKHDAMMKGQ